MRYRALGRSGVKVSALCLGCANFGHPADEDESVRIINEALDGGINFIDTANVYGVESGGSESILGRALKGRRDQVVLATKVHGGMGSGPNDRGNSRYHIMQQVEASLGRLQTDRIDLYQLHAVDADTPTEEQLSALTDLVRQGKVRYIGTSNHPAWRVCEAWWISEHRRFERFISEQSPYSMLNRGLEREVLPSCSRYGIAIMAYSPLSGCWLGGRYRKGRPAPADSLAVRAGWDLSSPQIQRRLDVVEKLVALADQAGLPLSQFALAWLLANPRVTPIIGPRTAAHVLDALPAVEATLDEAALAEVDRIVPPTTTI